jgi:hypothetical protein
MAKIGQLTPYQESQIAVVRDFWLNYLLSCDNKLDEEKAAHSINWLYRFCGKKEPKIIFCSSPHACQVEANKAHGNTKMKYYTVGWRGSVQDYGWVAFIDYFITTGLIKTDKEKDFNEYKELLLSGVFSMIQFEGLCIVSDLPCKISRDSENRLHDTKGYAIEFRDGYGQHYIHGRFIDSVFFEKCANGNLTREEYFVEDNDERRSAAYEIIGGEKMMAFLGAELVDETSIVHGNDDVETISIYRTKEKLNKFFDVPYAWLKRICPSTGTVYLTPTDPKFDKAIDAAKFHRPDFVPTDIPYSFNSRS